MTFLTVICMLAFGEVDDTLQGMFVAVSLTSWRTDARSRQHNRIIKPAASAEQKPAVAEPVT